MVTSDRMIGCVRLRREKSWGAKLVESWKSVGAGVIPVRAPG
jgi:hypothetical protein